jgi:hypothetical protein
MFSGILFPNSDAPHGLSGKLTDHFGDSNLSEVELASDSLKFSKCYERRSDMIRYAFSKCGTIWIGTYDGPVTGGGLTRCIITKTTEEELLLP